MSAWRLVPNGDPYTIETGEGPMLLARFEMPRERFEANARLIAAAPELLEALKAARHDLLHYRRMYLAAIRVPLSEAGEAPILVPIDALIRIATGEATDA
jgi:hypothetical protein